MTKDNEAILFGYIKRHGVSHRSLQTACTLYNINFNAGLRAMAKWASMGLIDYEDHVLLGHLTRKGMNYHVV